MGAAMDVRSYKNMSLKDAIDNFNKDIAEAILDHGRKGYTGTIAEKDRLQYSPILDGRLPAFNDYEDALDYLMEHSDKHEAALIVGFGETREGEGNWLIGGWCSE